MVTEQTFNIVRADSTIRAAYFASSQRSVGLVVIVHGWNDHHKSELMMQLTRSYTIAGCDVLTWDATGSAGVSSGEPGSAMFSSYRLDMDAVMQWASHQPWYKDPIILVGHSLGGAIAAAYATDPTKRVNKLVLISTYVAGHVSLAGVSRFKRLRIAFKALFLSRGKPHRRRRYKMMREALAIDLRDTASKLLLPTYLIVGELDRHTPPGQVDELAKNLPNLKMNKVISSAGHTFRSRQNQHDLNAALLKTLV